MPTLERRVIEVVIKDRASRNIAQINQRMGKMQQHAASLVSGLKGMGIAMGAAFAVSTLRTMQDMVDTFSEMSGRIALVTGSFNEAITAQTHLADSATRTFTSMDSLGTLYARIGVGAKDLRLEHEDLVKITETVAASFRISGATAAETASVMTQLSQAMIKGRADGDELKSIMETNAVITQIFADAMDAPIGKLKELGKQGKITGEKMAKGLLDAHERTLAAAQSIPVTVGRSIEVFKTRMQELLGLFFAPGEGGMGGISSVILGIADAMSVVSDNAELLKQSFANVGSAIATAVTPAGEALKLLGNAMQEEFTFEEQLDFWGKAFTEFFTVTLPALFASIPVELDNMMIQFEESWNRGNSHVAQVLDDISTAAGVTWTQISGGVEQLQAVFGASWSDIGTMFVTSVVDIVLGGLEQITAAIDSVMSYLGESSGLADTVAGWRESITEMADGSTDLQERMAEVSATTERTIAGIQQEAEARREQRAAVIEGSKAHAAAAHKAWESEVKMQKAIMTRNLAQAEQRDIIRETSKVVIDHAKNTERAAAAQGDLAKKTGGATKASKAQAKALKAQEKAQKAAQKAAEKQAKTLDNLLNKLNPARKLMEQYRKNLDLLAEGLEKGQLSQEEFNESVRAMTQNYEAELTKMENATNKKFGGMSNIIGGFASQIAGAFSGKSGGSGGSGGIGGLFGGLISSFFGGSGGGATGGSGGMGGMIGGLFSSAMESWGGGTSTTGGGRGSGLASVAGIAGKFLGGSGGGAGGMLGGLMGGGGGAGGLMGGAGGMMGGAAGGIGMAAGSLAGGAIFGKKVGGKEGAQNGAMIGATIGMAFGPVGAVIGGLIGGIAGGALFGDATEQRQQFIAGKGADVGESVYGQAFEGGVFSKTKGLSEGGFELAFGLGGKTHGYEAEEFKGIFDSFASIADQFAGLLSYETRKHVRNEVKSITSDMGGKGRGLAIDTDDPQEAMAYLFGRIVEFAAESGEQMAMLLKDAWDDTKGNAEKMMQILTKFKAAMDTLDVIATATISPLEEFEGKQAAAQATIWELGTETKKIIDDIAAEWSGMGLDSLDDLETLALAVRERYALEMKLLEFVSDTMANLTSMAESARERIIQDLLSPQELHNRYVEESNKAAANLEQASDPQDIAFYSEKAINAAMQAWSSLPEEERREKQADYLAFIDHIENTTAEQMQAAVEVAERDFAAMQEQISALLALNITSEKTADQTETIAENTEEIKDSNERLIEAIEQVYRRSYDSY